MIRSAVLALAVLVSPALAGGSGTDWSVNMQPPSGVLLQTVPALANREKIEIQAGCAAGISVVLDDRAGEGRATIFSVLGSPVDGAAGGGGYFTREHAGRVRVYSTNAACPVAIREWP